MSRIRSILSAAGLMACLGLGAQAPEGPVVSFGFNGATGDMLDCTRKIWGGHTAELGWQFAPKDYGCTLVPYLGWGKVPGEQDIPDRSYESLWGPNSYDFTNYRAGLDLHFQPFDRLPLRVALGPALHVWIVERVGLDALDYRNRGLNDQGIKVGWRLGVVYPVSANWEIGLRFTQTEWRAKRDLSGLAGFVNDTKTPSFIQGLNPCRPAYMTLMATYHF